MGAFFEELLELEAPHLWLLQKPDGGQVYLIGTCHASRRSQAEVRHVIRALRPDSVMVELCPSRAGVSGSRGRTPTLGDRELDTWQRSTRWPLLIQNSDLQSSISRPVCELESAGESLPQTRQAVSPLQLLRACCGQLIGDSAHGGEFSVGILEAERAGAHVVLGDRDIHLTLKREQRLVSIRCIATGVLNIIAATITVMSLPASLSSRYRDSLQLNAALSQSLRSAQDLPEGLEKQNTLKQLVGVRQQILHEVYRCGVIEILSKILGWQSSSPEELRRFMLSIDVAGSSMWWPGRSRRVLLDERDVILAHALKCCPGDVVVGVVGLAHLPGIRRRWSESTEGHSHLSSLFAVPEKPWLPQVATAGLVLSIPACTRIRCPRCRFFAGSAAAMLSGSIMGSLGWFSFFDKPRPY